MLWGEIIIAWLALSAVAIGIVAYIIGTAIRFAEGDDDEAQAAPVETEWEIIDCGGCAPPVMARRLIIPDAGSVINTGE